MSDESTPQAPQPSEMELLRAEMRAGFQSVSTRFDVVAEDLRERFKGIIDQTTATGTRGRPADRVEHDRARGLPGRDHGPRVRISRLEQGPNADRTQA
jgi:hypothetical protein